MKYIFLLIFSLALLPTACMGEIVFPPILLYGQLGYATFQTQRSKERENGNDAVQTSNTQNAFLNISASTYLYQPWFGTLNANAYLSDLTNNVENDDGGGIVNTEQEHTTEALGGGVQLNLFPASDFPFEAFFQQSSSLSDNVNSDSRKGGIPRNINNDRLLRRYGINQVYQPGGRLGPYRFRAESIATDENGIVEYGDFLRFSGRHRLEENQFDLDYFYEDIDRETPDDDSQTMLTELEHRYRPVQASRLYVRNRLSLEDETNILLSDRETNRQSIKFESFGTWDPAKIENLGLTSNIMIQNTHNQISSESITSDSLSANLSANYDYTREWSATAGVGVNAQEYDDVGLELAQYYETVGLRYRPDTIELGQYTYNWSSSGSLQHNHSKQLSSNTIGLGLAQGLNRRFPAGRGADITVTGNQSLDHRRLRSDFQDLGRDSLYLDQIYGVRYTRNNGPTRFFSSLRYNDSRQLMDNPRVTQSLNFQFSGNIKLGRYSTFSGNINWVKNLNEATLGASILRDEPERTAFSDEDTITVDLTYYHNRVFGLRRMRFDSELLILNRQTDRQDDNLDRLLNSQRVEQQTWRNALVYRIGLLEVSLAATLSRFDNENYRSLMFQVSRNFAGRF